MKIKEKIGYYRDLLFLKLFGVKNKTIKEIYNDYIFRKSIFNDLFEDNINYTNQINMIKNAVNTQADIINNINNRDLITRNKILEIIDIAFLEDSNIEEIIKDSIEISNSRIAVVRFVFNNVLMEIYPHSNLEENLEKYKKLLKNMIMDSNEKI